MITGSGLQSAPLISAEYVHGSGNQVVLCFSCENDPTGACAESIAKAVGPDVRAIVFDELPKPEEVEDYVECCLSIIAERGITRASLICLREAATVGLCLAIKKSRLIRNLVLIEPHLEIASSIFTRALDCVEEHLPLGLPLRKKSKAADPRPFMHMIGCPVLVILSSGSTREAMRQSESITSRIPNAWLRTLEMPADGIISGESKDANEIFKTFFSLPPRRSQKKSRNSA